MSLATLFSIPDTEPDLARFTLANASEHQEVNNAILAQKSVQITTYILEPMPTLGLAGWLLTHQAMHNQVNALLGTAGNDLTILDLKDRSAVEEWIFLHGDEHRNWRNALGI